MERNSLKEANRIVVKIGTSTLTYDNGKLNYKRIESIARVLSDLQNQGKQIILVSSGAIGIGAAKMQLTHKPETTDEKQAAAAVGQCELMHVYSRAFSDFGHLVAQMLLTRDIIEDENRKENVVNTFNELLLKGIIPIVNENDSVSVEEINFGDNDALSAIVSTLTGADLLLILSDIDGFYDSNPRENPDANLIDKVYVIDSNMEHAAGGAGSRRGTGGMQTKIHAASIATDANINTVIANGQYPELIYNILDGEKIGTLFVGKNKTVRGGTDNG